MDDMTLLRDYVASQSETAFTTLVERHIGLVYGAALRQVHDAQQAEEVTQVVFILLARKAGSLREGTILSSWLYRAARFAASDARKTQYRRHHREQEAARMQTFSADESAWEQIAPLLDEAMAKLGENDRNAVMLRFFEQKSLEEVGVALGIDAGTAQKRVWRAVEKLRHYFARRGVALSGATITTSLANHSVHVVPSGLAATVAAAAKGTAVTTSTAALLKGTLKLMAWTKAKIAVVGAVALALAAGTATVTVNHIRTIQAAAEIALWDNPTVNGDVFETVPPQVTIIPSKFPNSGKLSMLRASSGNMMMRGIGVPLSQILSTANRAGGPGGAGGRGRAFGGASGGGGGAGFGPGAGSPIVFTPLDMPTNKYDFIANLTNGSQEALLKAIEDKFGWAVKHENILTNGYALKAGQVNSSGLKPTGDADFESQDHQGKRFIQNWTMEQFANFIQGVIGVPVVDKTEMTGNYDFELTPPRSYPMATRLENVKDEMVNELGLKLVEASDLPLDMVKIEKVK